MPGNEEPDRITNRILYETKDPQHRLTGSGSLPAMTTLLYRVCDKDGPKFDEAVRLISLFIEQSIRLGQAEYLGK